MRVRQAPVSLLNSLVIVLHLSLVAHAATLSLATCLPNTFYSYCAPHTRMPNKTENDSGGFISRGSILWVGYD